MQRSLVLRVKCAERGGDSRPYPCDAFFHVWPKQCDPKFAAKKQLGRRTADGLPGWAAQYCFICSMAAAA
jgi:hypothetical protein